jgi:uncharacterized protein
MQRFRAGDLPGGIRRGAQDIVAVLEGDAGAFVERARERVGEEDTFGSAHPGHHLHRDHDVLARDFWRRPPPQYRRGGFGPIIFGGGGGLGGGFGRGGGGGFGGGFSGGGGSFGGGGASGRW